jgi:hypothetical protein
MFGVRDFLVEHARDVGSIPEFWHATFKFTLFAVSLLFLGSESFSLDNDFHLSFTLYLFLTFNYTLFSFFLLSLFC